MSDAAPPIERIAYQIKEAVQRAGVSRATLYRMAADGELELTKARGRTLISKAELERVFGRTKAAA